MNTATIVHLSDLHLSSDDAWDKLESVATAIQALDPKPDALIVSGDFLDHPGDGAVVITARKVRKFFGLKIPKGLADVRDALLAVCAKCAPSCPLIVVPGNHDYRNFGLASLEQGSAEFDQVFADWREARMLQVGDLMVAVFCLDSNTNDPKINAARGEVGTKEFLRFQREFDRLRTAHPGKFDACYKVAILHHHPLPIADSENAGHFSTDAYLGLDDAGIFMREMAAKGVDLVLHGHKHFAFNANIEVTAGLTTRRLTIVAAGSATKPGQKENSFNVFKIQPHTADFDRWALTEGVTFFLQTDTPIPVRHYDAYRHDAYQAFKRRGDTAYSMQRIVMSYSLLDYGDCDVSYERQGVRSSHNSTLQSLPVLYESPQATIANYEVRMTSRDHVKVKFKADGKNRDGLVSGKLVFQPHLDAKSAPISFEETYRLNNAFALTREQQIRMCTGDHSSADGSAAAPGAAGLDDDDEAGSDATEDVVAYITNPMEELVICAHFSGPKIEMPKAIRPLVYQGDRGNSHLDELRSTGLRFHISKCSRTATLTVSTPLRGLTYGIGWDLPAAPKPTSTLYSEGQCDEIRHRLLALDTADRTKNTLRPVFVDAHTRLAKEWKTRPDKLQLGLMAFDARPEVMALRFVAGVINDAYWTYHLREGQGIAGRAHKLGSALINVPNRTKMSLAADPPPGETMPKILICVPLRYPILQQGENSGETVGVITLNTDDPASKLLTVFDNNKLLDALTLEFQVFFLKNILPALGFDQEWLDNAVQT